MNLEFECVPAKARVYEAPRSRGSRRGDRRARRSRGGTRSRMAPLRRGSMPSNAPSSALASSGSAVVKLGVVPPVRHRRRAGVPVRRGRAEPRRARTQPAQKERKLVGVLVARVTRRPGIARVSRPPPFPAPASCSPHLPRGALRRRAWRPRLRRAHEDLPAALRVDAEHGVGIRPSRRRGRRLE